MNTLKYNLYFLESQFIGYPMVIKITILLITILSIIYLISLLRIFLIARTQKIDKMREETIKKRYENTLQKILFTKENISITEVRNKLGIKNRQLKEWEKSKITHLIIDLIKQNQKIELKTEQ
ncbi:hypothetical protein [Brumimicrobium aurantiacum]|uniref:Uncharacterized protein n=1 Tax=Brumimicrobium aurantiacum TaxID=1737063 RepID=A0A3E1EXP9_9FLAO|nr:hypothetical protein [Brumimicrobium aurantiacum]RFC54336.1 hypothetical protein DXU93_07875 [Brumimicrobium aurantiacum]